MTSIQHWGKVYEGLSSQEIVLLHRLADRRGADPFNAAQVGAVRRSAAFAVRLLHHRAGATLIAVGRAWQARAMP